MKWQFTLVALAAGSVLAGTDDDAAIVARFRDYGKMPRITTEKIDMARAASLLCRAPDPEPRPNPHRQPGIHLYANSAVIETVGKIPRPGHYPIGSVIVKEKYEARDDAKPDIITVMEKVTDRGRVEDWRFYMIRLSDQSLVREGFSVSCVECHVKYRNTDYVSPATTMLLLKYARPAPTR